DLPHGQAEAPAHDGELVHEGNVDATEDVLEELDELGGLGRGHGHHSIDHQPVEDAREIAAGGGDAAHDLRNALEPPRAITRIDALGGEGEEELLSHRKPGGGKAGQEDFLGRTWI